MAYRIRRRDFLKITVVSAAAMGAGPLAACSSGEGGGENEDPSAPADVLRVFPQGLASGDPRPDSIILWTRVGSAKGDEKVTFRVTTDPKLMDVVAEGELTAQAANDHTVRVKVKDLDPYTTYYYRFKAQGVRSDLGRTKTAPSDDQDVGPHFAFAACQDFVGRYYHAWRALIDEGKDNIDFVLHLGDYVYETDGDPDFMTPTEERKIVLPDGLEISSTTNAAVSLADYRSLYKQYRSDPDLKEAHRLFPFICIWDDHEFGNDCWQDHTTHFNELNGPEEVPQQREDADQAWHEYQAADVEYDASAAYPNDIKIYRTLRYGKHVELFLTDQRYYRSDHVIPEGPADATVGKFFANSEQGSRIFVLKSGFDPKEAAALPTMLGDEQKAWLIQSIKDSKATWKLWANEVQLSQMLADLSSFPLPLEQLKDKWYLTCDQWDGYRTERAEILTALSGVSNLVALTGDIHAFYASELHIDFDNPGPTPVAVEYVTAGISSQAVAPAALSILSQPTYASFGLADLVPQWDTILAQASPHYKYRNSFANGIALCEVSAAEINVTFLIVGDVQMKDDKGVKERVKLRTASGANTIETVA